jgi:Flp pilus assembly protein TadB
MYPLLARIALYAGFFFHDAARHARRTKKKRRLMAALTQKQSSLVTWDSQPRQQITFRGPE